MMIKANVGVTRIFDVRENVPEEGDTYEGLEITIVRELHPVSGDTENYRFYEVTTTDGDDTFEQYVAVEIDHDAEMKAECVGKTWEWICQDDYYRDRLFDEATAIDGRTGNAPKQSGECIVNLGLGLCVPGKIEIGEDEDVITIDDGAVVYDPEA